MSHHSVESMRDIAFRKGRNGFKSDDDYLRALRGEELEDETFENEEDEPLDEKDEPLDDEEDEPLDEEDEPLLDGLDKFEIDDLENVFFDVIVESSHKKVNTIFDWIMKAEAGDCPKKLTFTHSGVTVKMSIAGKDLEFETTCDGLTIIHGRYSFENFLTDVQDMLMEEGSPYCTICDVVKNYLDTARRYGYADVWKEDIAKFMADYGKVFTDSESNLNLLCKETGMYIRFIRRPLLSDGDTLWTLSDLTSPDPTLKTVLKNRDGHPTKLLQWLFGREGLIDILRPEE